MSNHLPPLCIYHGNCLDGFGAAWVVRQANPDAECIPARYGAPAPYVAGRTVYIVDFSYPRDVLLAMAAKAHRVVIIDHHKSAAEQLIDLPANVLTVFSMEQSGCMLAWKHFFPDQCAPPLLVHIQDQDLWQFEMPLTKTLMAALMSHPYDFMLWDRLMQDPVHMLAKDGEAILRKHRKDLAELLPNAQRMTIGGHDVPAINLPYQYASDAGEALSQGEPFAAVYIDEPDGRRFSLRSSKAGMDVAAIASQYGGGGHEHAAGFKVTRDHYLVTGMSQDAPPGWKVVPLEPMPEIIGAAAAAAWPVPSAKDMELARKAALIVLHSMMAPAEGASLDACAAAIATMAPAYRAMVAAAPTLAGQHSFQWRVSEWMRQCFIPSLYSDMTERGDRLLEEVLELLQAHGYDRSRVATLVDYVFGRPIGDPAQEVGGVMVTLAGFCWIAGLNMHAAGETELARISQPEVMRKIQRKQQAKNALHFDTPLPGDASDKVGVP